MIQFADENWGALVTALMEVISDVRHRHGDRFRPKLAGGARLVLELRHRGTVGMDLVLGDAEYMSWVSPRRNPFIRLKALDHDEMGDRIWILLPEGELSFRVRRSLLGLPDQRSPFIDLPLEPVAEVIAKKLFYACAALTVADLYDLWSAEMKLGGIVSTGLIRLLQPRCKDIDGALARLTRSDRSRIEWQRMVSAEAIDLDAAIVWAKDFIIEPIRIKKGFHGAE